jgi:hypothetical protein
VKQLTLKSEELNQLLKNINAMMKMERQTKACDLIQQRVKSNMKTVANEFKAMEVYLQ